MKNNSLRALAELVKIVECGLSEKEVKFRFRVEIFKTIGKLRETYFAKIWRSDMYRLQPMVFSSDGILSEHKADERILVEEEVLLERSELRAKSEAELMRKIVAAINARYLDNGAGG